MSFWEFSCPLLQSSHYRCLNYAAGFCMGPENLNAGPSHWYKHLCHLAVSLFPNVLVKPKFSHVSSGNPTAPCTRTVVKTQRDCLLLTCLAGSYKSVHTANFYVFIPADYLFQFEPSLLAEAKRKKFFPLPETLTAPNTC